MRRSEGFHRSRGRWRPNERQRRVLDLLLDGRTNAEIAAELAITLDGAKWHVSELLAATGASDRKQLADWWQAERDKRAQPALLPWLPRLLVGGAALAAAVVLAVVVLDVFSGGPDGSAVAREPPIDLGADGAPSGVASLLDEPPPYCDEPLPGDLASDLGPAPEPWQLERAGYVPQGEAILSAECPFLVANRADRAYVFSLGDLDVVDGSRLYDYGGPGTQVVVPAVPDETGRRHAVAIASDGALWVDPAPLPLDAVVEFRTGRPVDVSDATRLGRLLPEGRPAGWAQPVFYFAACESETSCYVAIRHGPTGLVAPVDGTLRCLPRRDDGPVAIELDAGAFLLRFEKVLPSPGDDGVCETRQVHQGEVIGRHGHYGIEAYLPSGEQIPVVIGEDSTLYVGAIHVDLECPCQEAN